MSKKESWGSRVGLILSMSGNAVGFGNFLRFPVQAAQNGGGAFLIPYLICFLLMGIPLFLMEWAMGRLGGKSGNHNTPFIIHTLGKGRKIWKYVGAIGIFSNIAILAYYSYLESWTISYVMHSLSGTFSGMSQSEVARFFENYVNINVSTTFIPYEAVVVYILCILLNTYILSKGLKGIEKMAKIGMPLLLLFALALAIKGWTLGTSGATTEHPDANAWDGLNFLWNPQFETIWDPKVWLAAAGQIFFTLSMGMGLIQCYASYIKSKEDIALGALTSGFINEFTEVILASGIIIPIAAGYLGINWVKENAGFGMAFQTMPYLLQQWGSILAPLGGLFWFGLLFFAGITTALAFGTPWVGMLRDGFQWKREKSAWVLGALVFIVGIPTVLFYNQGVFDEYDYWAGTLSIVLLALLESIAFVWVLGMDKGWKEINEGADIKLPIALKYISQYITPYLLLVVLLAAIFTPLNNDWIVAIKNLTSGNGWMLDNSSLIKTITQASLKERILQSTDPIVIAQLEHKMSWINFARILLIILFISVCLLVHQAAKRHRERNVIT
ncbi:MAG: sodium-dependent transporter [Flavobacteriales bacterium AspAUS03]